MDFSVGSAGCDLGIVVGVMTDSVDFTIVGDPALDLNFIRHHLIILADRVVLVWGFSFIFLPEHLLV